jgi:hypothetical protein
MAGDDEIHEEIELDPGDFEIRQYEKDGEPWVVRIIAAACPPSGGQGPESDKPPFPKERVPVSALRMADLLMAELNEAHGGVVRLASGTSTITIEPDAMAPLLGDWQAQMPAVLCSTRLEPTADEAPNSFGVRVDPRLAVSPGTQALLVILPDVSPERASD